MKSNEKFSLIHIGAYTIFIAIALMFISTILSTINSFLTDTNLELGFELLDIVVCLLFFSILALIAVGYLRDKKIIKNIGLAFFSIYSLLSVLTQYRTLILFSSFSKFNTDGDKYIVIFRMITAGLFFIISLCQLFSNKIMQIISFIAAGANVVCTIAQIILLSNFSLGKVSDLLLCIGFSICAFSQFRKASIN